MKLKLLAALLLFSGYLKAQNVNIIPQPRSVINAAGQFNFNNHTTIGVSDTSLISLASYFQKEISKAKGLTLVVSNSEAASAIDLNVYTIPESSPFQCTFHCLPAFDI